MVTLTFSVTRAATPNKSDHPSNSPLGSLYLADTHPQSFEPGVKLPERVMPLLTIKYKIPKTSGALPSLSPLGKVYAHDTISTPELDCRVRTGQGPQSCFTLSWDLMGMAPTLGWGTMTHLGCKGHRPRAQV